MANFTNPLPQTVEAGANVLFTDTAIEPCCKVRHREGSGIFTLKGGKYLVSFNGNIAIPTGSTLGQATLALSLNGEALQGGVMTARPTGADLFFNVSSLLEIEVPCNCCYTLSVRNISAVPLTVDDANLVTIREVQ